MASGILRVVRDGPHRPGQFLARRDEPLLIASGQDDLGIGRQSEGVDALFEQLTQRTIDRSMTLLTPALTMIMAAFVGGVIITIMDAIMSMNGLAF